MKLRHKTTPQTHPLQATVTLLRLLGCTPLSRNKSGDYSFNIRSPWSIYCGVSMGLKVAMMVTVLIDYYIQMERWRSFDSAVTSLMNASLLVSLAHAVLCTWSKSSQIAEALNGWRRLQESFQAAEADRISSWLLDHPYTGVTLITSYLIFIEYIPLLIYFTFYTDVKNRVTKATSVMYFLATWYIKLVLWFWLVFTHSVSQAAKILKKSLNEMMAGDPNVERLRLHRSLWVKLHNYTCAVTAAVGSTVRAWLFTVVFSLHLSIYVTCLSFANGSNKISSIIPLMLRALQVFLLNNATYLAERQINYDFVVKLLSFNYSYFSEEQLEEVELFLYSIENSSAQFSLEHMVKPSRETLIDILQLALTFMVILLQFRESS